MGKQKEDERRSSVRPAVVQCSRHKRPNCREPRCQAEAEAKRKEAGS